MDKEAIDTLRAIYIRLDYALRAERGADSPATYDSVQAQQAFRKEVKEIADEVRNRVTQEEALALSTIEVTDDFPQTGVVKEV